MENTGTLLPKHPDETSTAHAAMQTVKLRPSKKVSLWHS